MFKKVDSDSDGCLSKQEIIQAFLQIGVDPTREIDAIIQNLDINGNGEIDFTEIKIALID